MSEYLERHGRAPFLEFDVLARENAHRDYCDRGRDLLSAELRLERQLLGRGDYAHGGPSLFLGKSFWPTGECRHARPRLGVSRWLPSSTRQGSTMDQSRFLKGPLARAAFFLRLGTRFDTRPC